MGQLSGFCHSVAVAAHRGVRRKLRLEPNLALDSGALRPSCAYSNKFFLSEVSVKTIHHYQEKVQWSHRGIAAKFKYDRPINYGDSVGLFMRAPGTNKSV